MRGLLADVNVQGHLPYLCRQLKALDLMSVLAISNSNSRHFPTSGSLAISTTANYCSG